MSKPEINVTPLIDVLLVLLIIFMIIAPLKPSRFEAKLPNEPKNTTILEPNPYTLVVAVDANKNLHLNKEKNLGSTENPENLIAKLQETFQKRTENEVYSQSSDGKTIEKTVFIKAPKTIDYGSVAKVVDAVKQAGAEPISLQIDDLD
jgi:biopolymer transport protein ExbD